MVHTNWAGWLVVIILAFASVMLLSGRFSWMIAGYNMLSREEKKRYDEKRLCQVTGVGLSVATVLLAVWLFTVRLLPGWSSWIFTALILVDVVATMLLSEKLCRKRNP